LAAKPSDHTRYDEEVFEGIDLAGEGLHSTLFYDCTFVHSHFDEAIFSKCRLKNVTFRQCHLSLIKLSGTVVSGCRFEECKITGVDWTAADWASIMIAEPLVFQECDISHSTFIGLPMKKTEFIRCIAHDVDFREGDFTSAQFTGTDLSESMFGQTLLTGANFSNARNYNIDPIENRISGAAFSLPEAISLLYALDIELVD